VKIRLGFLFLVFGSVVQGMEQVIPWGMSSRANGKMKAGKFEQEDTFSQANIENGGKWIAIFDGHGGPQDEIRTCDQLQKKLHKYFERAEGNEQVRFSAAFGSAESKVMKNFRTQDNGSMAVVLYIKDGKAYVAHAGDARAICFGDNGIVSFATKDHVLEREDELARIKTVYSDQRRFEKRVHMKDDIHKCSRINGLPTTRLIGDPSSKGVSQKNPNSDGAIIAEPEYASFYLSQNNKYSILATDGIWDVMTDQEAAKIINDAMADTVENLREKYAEKPIVVHKGFNQTIRKVLINFINDMDEESFNQRYSAKPWNTIADEHGISDITIRDYFTKRPYLGVTEENFNTIYRDNSLSDRTPMIEDLTEEQVSSEHDEKLKLVARALREVAVERGSGDNIAVCVVDLSQYINDVPQSLPYYKQLQRWWHFLSGLKKGIVGSASVTALVAAVGAVYYNLAR